MEAWPDYEVYCCVRFGLGMPQGGWWMAISQRHCVIAGTEARMCSLGELCDGLSSG